MSCDWCSVRAFAGTSRSRTIEACTCRIIVFLGFPPEIIWKCFWMKRWKIWLWVLRISDVLNWLLRSKRTPAWFKDFSRKPTRGHSFIGIHTSFFHEKVQSVAESRVWPFVGTRPLCWSYSAQSEPKLNKSSGLLQKWNASLALEYTPVMHYLRNEYRNSGFLDMIPEFRDLGSEFRKPWVQGSEFRKP